MKDWLCKISLALVASAFMLAAEAAPDEELFTKTKLNILTSSPPTYRNQPGSIIGSVKGNLRNEWVVFTVEFTPVVPNRQRFLWLDDVTLTMRAVFQGNIDGKSDFILFTGKSEYWTIAMDNRQHIATMMIPPHLLDRYLSAMGSSSTVSTSSTFTVEAVFTDSRGNVLGYAYAGPKNWPDKTFAEYFQEVDRVKPFTVPGAILPRNQTPWALLDIDDHDLLKPTPGIYSGSR